MVICGSYVFEFTVSKDMKKSQVHWNSCFLRKGGGSREDNGTFMFNTNGQGIEN